MLQGKYLKYTEDITLEIFTKIIERLNKTGWKHLVDTSIDSQFNEFTHDKYLVYCTAKNNYSFYKDSVLKSTDVELKVSDILGEDWDIEKPRFEVGKWYRSKSCATLYLNPSRNEVIWSSEEFEKLYAPNENINDWLLLTDLSEIQQYLPDNHPDKIVKSIEKWSVGSYVVAIKDGKHGYDQNREEIKLGTIALISHSWGDKDSTIGIKGCGTVIQKEIFKWFATLSEAEAFSKSLLEPEEDDTCQTCNGEGTVMVGKLYPNGHTEVDEDCPDCNGLGYIEKAPKTLSVDDLVEGEIYFTTYDGKSQDHIFQLISGDLDRCENFCITNGAFTTSTRYFGKTTKYGKNLRIAAPEEKKWLLTCIKQDKFIPQDQLDMYDSEGNLLEDTPKFKIGDWVVVIPSNNHYYNYKKAIGHIFPIRGDGSHYQNFIKGKSSAIDLNNTYKINYRLEDVRLATPEEIAKVTKPKTKQFEFNKWYKYKGESNYLVFIHKDGRYGFDCEGNWFDSKYQEGPIEHFKPSEWEVVKDSEVKERLLSYAKGKYPIGTKFKCMAYDKEFTVTDPNYMDNNNGLKPNNDSTIWIGVKEQYSGKIFNGKGKWAEVISKPEPEESKEFDRNWYVEVNSQEEADKVFDWLESQGEKIDRKWNEFSNLWKYIVIRQKDPIWILTCDNNCYKRGFIEKQLLDILPEYKQSIKTEEELSHIFDTNKELRCEIQGLINQRDFKSSDFAEPIVIKNKKQKRNKLIIVNN